jgi:hypothetical protein
MADVGQRLVLFPPLQDLGIDLLLAGREQVVIRVGEDAVVRELRPVLSS